MRRTFSTYGAKMRQANREAVATVVALAVIVAVWLVGGIGLAGCGIEVFSTPLWIFLPPFWLTGVLMVLVAPVVAGLAGRWARSGPPWRTWVLLGVAAALLVATAVSVLVA